MPPFYPKGVVLVFLHPFSASQASGKPSGKWLWFPKKVWSPEIRQKHGETPRDGHGGYLWWGPDGSFFSKRWWLNSGEMVGTSRAIWTNDQFVCIYIYIYHISNWNTTLKRIIFHQLLHPFISATVTTVWLKNPTAYSLKQEQNSKNWISSVLLVGH